MGSEDPDTPLLAGQQTSSSWRSTMAVKAMRNRPLIIFLVMLFLVAMWAGAGFDCMLCAHALFLTQLLELWCESQQRTQEGSQWRYGSKPPDEAGP